MLHFLLTWCFALELVLLARLIYDSVEEDANVIFGALIDESLDDSISITVLATGFADNSKQNLEFLNDVVSGGLMKDNASDGMMPTQQMSRKKNTPSEIVPEYEDEYDDDEETDDGDDRIPSFLRGLKRKR